MCDIGVRTYRDLLQKLVTCSDEQLAQPIQIAMSHPSDEHVYDLQMGICFATIDQLELRYVRSVVDNRRNGKELVIYTDGNPHGECGAIAYEMKAGDSFDSIKDHPIYPKGHDDSCDWTGPAQKLIDSQELPVGEGVIGQTLVSRLSNFREKLENGEQV